MYLLLFNSGLNLSPFAGKGILTLLPHLQTLFVFLLLHESAPLEMDSFLLFIKRKSLPMEWYTVAKAQTRVKDAPKMLWEKLNTHTKHK